MNKKLPYIPIIAISGDDKDSISTVDPKRGFDDFCIIRV